ncbi:MAG: hypothetical protein ACPG3T_05170, partial [Pseudomonadales bacterium]
MNKQTITEAMNGRPDQMPIRKNSLVTNIAMFFWWLSGWRIVGSLPNEKKLLVAAAPHTSNWDFIVGLPIILALGIKGTIMMKK